MMSPFSLLSPPIHRKAVFGVLAMVPLSAAGAMALRAQVLLPAPVTVKTPPANRRQVDVTSAFYSDITATKIRTLRGNVRITTEGTVLKTDLAQYNYATNVAVSPGKLSIDDGNNTITGDNGKAYYQSRTAVILGNVKIVVRPRAEDANAKDGSVRSEFHEPVTVSCDRVDFDWRTHIAVATGHLILKQVTSAGVTRTATAQKLIYASESEVVTLNGDVRAEDTEHQKFAAQVATMNLKRGSESFTMGDITHPGSGVTSTIFIKDDEDTASNKTSGAKGTAPLPAPPASPEGVSAPPPAPASTPTPVDTPAPTVTPTPPSNANPK